MSDTFQIEYTGHEAQARRLVLEKKLATAEKLAMMCKFEVEKLVNDNFVVFKVDVDWLLIPKDKADAILKQIAWIER